MNGRNKKTSAKTHTRNTKPNRKTTVRTQWTGSIKRANGSLFQLYICVAVRIILSNLTPYNSYWVRSLFDDRLKVKSYIFVKCVYEKWEARASERCGCMWLCWSATGGWIEKTILPISFAPHRLPTCYLYRANSIALNKIRTQTREKERDLKFC